LTIDFPFSSPRRGIIF